MIFEGNNPQQILWDITKDLWQKNGIPIYKEIMHEEAKDIPASYILLRSEITDVDDIFGDGKCLMRYSDCDIILVTKGYADNSTDLHNINKELIKKHLQAQDIPYKSYNIGYNDLTKSTEHTFTIGVEYFGS